MKTFYVLEETWNRAEEGVRTAHYTAALPALRIEEDNQPVVGTGANSGEALSRLVWNLKAALRSGRKLPPSTVATFDLWAAKVGWDKDSGDDIVATGEVTINYGPPADKSTDQKVLEIRGLPDDKQMQ